jgi:DNA-binding response OmpR family regulator
MGERDAEGTLMSDAPHRAPSAELELYRAVMHRRLAGLRHAAPGLSVPSGSGPDSLTPDVEITAPPADVMIQSAGPGQILLVEDEHALARAYTRTLKLHGLEATWVTDATSALGELRTRNYDVVVSDIMLPDHSGLDLLRHVRNSDPDLPMVLVTGMPNLDSAIDAVALGAFRYLVKPVSNDRLIGCIAQAQRTRQVARLREEALTKAHGAPGSGSGDAELSRAFERALEPLWIAYQPVISWPDRSIYAYQALVRSDEPSLALPSALLSAAERLGRSQELSRAVRRSVAKTARGLPAGTRVIVHSVASDLLDPDLYSRTSPLGAVAERVALDIVDPPGLSRVPELESRVRELNSLGYRIAVSLDGSGHIDFSRFAALSPDIVKIDVAAPDGLNQLAMQHGLERAAEWCDQHGRDLIVEGVERDDERTRLLNVGCRLFQDCLFTQPGRKLSRA